MQVVERRLEQAAEESRRGGRESQGMQVLAGSALGGYPFGCHSRFAGMDFVNHWIPAFACLLQAGRNDGGGWG